MKRSVSMRIAQKQNFSNKTSLPLKTISMNISEPTTSATEDLTQSLLQLQTVGQSNLIEIINYDSPENIPEIPL